MPRLLACFSRSHVSRRLACALGLAGLLAGLAAVPNGALAAEGGAPVALSPGLTQTSFEQQAQGKYGFAVAEDADYRVVGSPGQDIPKLSGEGTDDEAGVVFVYSTANGGLVRRIPSPNTEGKRLFGSAVAVEGEDVIVGAPHASDTGPTGSDAGVVYVFNASSGTLLSTITSPRAAIEGHFGASLAVDGEGGVVVGAPGEESGVTGGTEDAGNAYLFSVSTGALLARFTSRAPVVGGEFGAAVAAAGGSVVVGAPGETAGAGRKAGNAYVFSEETGALTRKLESPEPAEDGAFGSAVAASGASVAVGEREAGRAYTFNASTGAVKQTLIDPNAATTSGEKFGASIALSPEYVVVGAPSATAGGVSAAGTAYVYTATSGELVYTLAATSPQDGAGFAAEPVSLSISGDEVIVGAPDQTVSALADAGEASVFSLSPAASSEPPVTPPGEAPLTGPTMPSVTLKSLEGEGQAAGQYGYAVAEDQDFRVVGAPGQSVTTKKEVGVAYVYDTATGALLRALQSPSVDSDWRFGAAVAVEGEDVIVGAPTTTGTGNVYVFNASTGKLLSTIANPRSAEDGHFGSSLAVDGDGGVVVGAPGDTSGVTGGTAKAGDAYLFSVSTGALLQQFASPAPVAEGEFGDSVAAEGGSVVVGAPGETATAGAKAGNAYVFSEQTGAVTQTLVSPEPLAGGGGAFGSAVAVSAGSVAVAEAQAGRAYTFNASTGTVKHKLSDPNAATTAGEKFGASLALDSEYVVVGAPRANVEGVREAGSAYVYTATGGALVYTLLTAAPQRGSLFAEEPGSLAINGDEVTTGAAGTGEAFTFSLSPAASSEPPVTPPGEAPPTGPTTPITTQTSAEGQAGGHYGFAVAEDEDFRVVGSPGQEAKNAAGTERKEAGIVYVYDVETGALLQTLKTPAAETEGQFGAAVAVEGEDVIVGAPGQVYTVGGDTQRVGNVYVFNASSGALLSTIISPRYVYGGRFGASLAVDGDGGVVVGAPGETSGESGGTANAGNAYLINVETGAVMEKLFSPAPVAEGEFGDSVAAAGETVVVGAPGQTATAGVKAGNAYVFDGKTGAVTQTLVSPEPLAGGGGAFGSAVAASGSSVAVGEREAGRAYTFNASTGAVERTLTDPNAATSTGEKFGASIALGPEYVVVGAPTASVEGVRQAGSAYVYTVTGGKLVFTLLTASLERGSLFAEEPGSLAINGEKVIVGAPYETTGELAAVGGAYMFDVPSQEEEEAAHTKKVEEEREAAREAQTKAEEEREAARQEQAKDEQEREAARQEQAKDEQEREAARQEQAKDEQEREAARQEQAKDEQEREAARQEQAKDEQERNSAHEKQVKAEEEKTNASAKQAKAEEEKATAAAKQAKAEEEKANAAAKQAKLEEEKANAAAKQAKLEEEKANAAAKQAKAEEEKADAAIKQAKAEEEKASAAAKQAKAEEERASAAAKQAKAEKERANAAAKQAKAEKERDAAKKKNAKKKTAKKVKKTKAHKTKTHKTKVDKK